MQLERHFKTKFIEINNMMEKLSLISDNIIKFGRGIESLFCHITPSFKTMILFSAINRLINKSHSHCRLYNI